MTLLEIYLCDIRQCRDNIFEEVWVRDLKIKKMNEINFVWNGSTIENLQTLMTALAHTLFFLSGKHVDWLFKWGGTHQWKWIFENFWMLKQKAEGTESFYMTDAFQYFLTHALKWAERGLINFNELLTFAHRLITHLIERIWWTILNPLDVFLKTPRKVTFLSCRIRTLSQFFSNTNGFSTIF